MTSEELIAQHKVDDLTISSLLEDNAKILEVMEAMAEAARRLEGGFRDTLATYNLRTDSHRAAFVYYKKALKLYQELKHLNPII